MGFFCVAQQGETSPALDHWVSPCDVLVCVLLLFVWIQRGAGIGRGPLYRLVVPTSYTMPGMVDEEMCGSPRGL